MITHQKKLTWVRIAGNAANLKKGNKHGWRCFILTSRDEVSGTEIPLLNFRLGGETTAENFIPGVRQDFTNMTDGVVAWIDLYGDVEVKDEFLSVTLRRPV